MPETAPDGALPLCAGADLAEAGPAHVFDVLLWRRPARAFALRFEGRVVAYMNRCAHVPTEMDWRPGEFLDTERRFIMCSMHGAVYEPTTDAHSFAVTMRAIVLQPKGSDLVVGEEYTIQNQTHPPVAYYLKDGTFKFQVPQGGQLNQVSAWGATGMPVIQGTIDKGNGVEAVDWPFRPGDNGVRLSYQLPYTSNQATFRTASPYNVQRVLLVVPPGLQVSSPGFTPAGTQQGYDIYTRDSVAANAPLTISLSGTAAEPAPADNSQDPSVNSRADANGEAAATTTLPPRVSSNLQYILVVGFAALFLLGVIFLWRRPVTETVPPAGTNASAAKKARNRHGDSASIPENRSAAPNQTVAEVERDVSHSLDELKEKLFRLELRRQAGTISEEEYAREHQRTEKILRDFVKG